MTTFWLMSGHNYRLRPFEWCISAHFQFVSLFEKAATWNAILNVKQWQIKCTESRTNVLLSVHFIVFYPSTMYMTEYFVQRLAAVISSVNVGLASKVPDSCSLANLFFVTSASFLFHLFHTTQVKAPPTTEIPAWRLKQMLPNELDMYSAIAHWFL